MTHCFSIVLESDFDSMHICFSSCISVQAIRVGPVPVEEAINCKNESCCGRLTKYEKFQNRESYLNHEFKTHAKIFQKKQRFQTDFH